MEEVLKEVTVCETVLLTCRLTKYENQYLLGFYIDGVVHGIPIRSGNYERMLEMYNNISALC